MDCFAAAFTLCRANPGGCGAFFPGRRRFSTWRLPSGFLQSEPAERPSRGIPLDVCNVENPAAYDSKLAMQDSRGGREPLKEVRFGEATNQEMLVGFIGYIDDPGPGVKVALNRD